MLYVNLFRGNVCPKVFALGAWNTSFHNGSKFGQRVHKKISLNDMTIFLIYKSVFLATTAAILALIALKIKTN